MNVSDPVGQGFVASLAHPGGNTTGFTLFEFSMGTKWVEILRELAPTTKHIGFLFNRVGYAYATLFLQAVRAAAENFKIDVIPLPVEEDAEIERSLTALAQQPDSGLIALHDPFTIKRRDLVIAQVARHRIPTVYTLRPFALSGGLISYGIDLADPWRKAATYVDRVLRFIGGASLNSSGMAAQYQAFLTELKELGFSEGKNIVVDYRRLDDPTRGPFAIAAELMRLQVDLIVATGPEVAMQSVVGASRAIPIVFLAVQYDPIERGYVASLARPGGNITGVFYRQPELAAKQLEILTQAFPQKSRLAVLYDTARSFANGLTTSRAHSMSSFVAGLTVRFFNVMIPLSHGGMVILPAIP